MFDNCVRGHLRGTDVGVRSHDEPVQLLGRRVFWRYTRRLLTIKEKVADHGLVFDPTNGDVTLVFMAALPRDWLFFLN